ncbi:uncharacterized protein G2W53_033905 [Senna tora]|uniref:Uncharacterized protein n=1 Tax=Senna tora TaxID=362788 RepID=A0A834WDB2_9FABA|nr:uncharacterized protein G2W53_033905 [Senna tora]
MAAELPRKANMEEAPYSLSNIFRQVPR